MPYNLYAIQFINISREINQMLIYQIGKRGKRERIGQTQRKRGNHHCMTRLKELPTEFTETLNSTRLGQ